MKIEKVIKYQKIKLTTKTVIKIFNNLTKTKSCQYKLSLLGYQHKVGNEVFSKTKIISYRIIFRGV